MSESPKSTTAQSVTESSEPDPSALALARCHAAYRKAKEAYAKVHGPHTIESYEAEKLARQAYRNAMPALTSREGIRAFIACVARGVILEAIRENTSSRLLYAAQVALGGLPRESHHSISTSSSQENRERPTHSTNQLTKN
jgi:hypothetical protein